MAQGATNGKHNGSDHCFVRLKIRATHGFHRIFDNLFLLQFQILRLRNESYAPSVYSKRRMRARDKLFVPRSAGLIAVAIFFNTITPDSTCDCTQSTRTLKCRTRPTPERSLKHSFGRGCIEVMHNAWKNIARQETHALSCQHGVADVASGC